MKQNKYTYLFVVQQYYPSYGWEDVAASET